MHGRCSRSFCRTLILSLFVWRDKRLSFCITTQSNKKPTNFTLPRNIMLRLRTIPVTTISLEGHWSNNWCAHILLKQYAMINRFAVDVQCKPVLRLKKWSASGGYLMQWSSANCATRHTFRVFPFSASSDRRREERGTLCRPLWRTEKRATSFVAGGLHFLARSARHLIMEANYVFFYATAQEAAGKRFSFTNRKLYF